MLWSVWGAYNLQKLISHSVGGWEVPGQSLADLIHSCPPAATSHGPRELAGASLLRALIPFGRAPPHDSVTSPKASPPNAIILDVGFQHGNWEREEGHKHSVPSRKGGGGTACGPGPASGVCAGEGCLLLEAQGERQQDASRGHCQLLIIRDGQVTDCSVLSRWWAGTLQGEACEAAAVSLSSGLCTDDKMMAVWSTHNQLSPCCPCI